MALLLLNDGTVHSDLGEIAKELAPLGISLRHYDPGTSLLFAELLEQDLLSDDQKREIVETHNSVFDFFKQERGYQWSDLLSIHPGSPNLHTLIATHNRYHVHTAPEAVYVLYGEAIFGLIRLDGTQIQLLVQPQDYIHIPAGVEHWFSLGTSLQFKGVRYFTTVEGWIPQYTGTKMVNSQGKV